MMEMLAAAGNRGTCTDKTTHPTCMPVYTPPDPVGRGGVPYTLDGMQGRAPGAAWCLAATLTRRPPSYVTGPNGRLRRPPHPPGLWQHPEGPGPLQAGPGTKQAT